MAEATRSNYGDDQMLHQWLVALRAIVVDWAENVQLRHVARRTTLRDVITHCPVAPHVAGRAVAAKTGDVDKCEFLEIPLTHVVFVHEEQGAQVLHAAIAVVVGIDCGVELVVRAHGR